MIILAAVTAHETKPSALVGAPPLALVSSGLDPVSGGALSVSTLVDQKYAHLIANFAHHMHAALPTVRYNVLTIDAAAQRQCQSFAGPSFKMTCLAAFPVETRNKTFVRRPSDKNHYADPVFLYKTIITRELAIHTNFGGGSVLLDITAFVLSEACWAELLHQNADFVVTVSNGMKSDFSRKHGLVPNTGLTLSRSGSLPLINDWLAVHRRVGGPQQPALMRALSTILLHRSKGTNGPSAMGLWPTGTTTVALQFLPEPRWARAPKNISNACLFHPFVPGHNTHEESFRAVGLWYGQ